MNSIQVKICGITNAEDACAALEAGADLLGFVFYPPSLRCLDDERAAALAAEIRGWNRKVKLVGVFVNAPLERVQSVMAACNLDLAQLHGEESPALVAALPGRAYKALRVRREDPEQARQLAEQYRPSLNGSILSFIVDAYSSQSYGGTGERTDWEIARDLACEFSILLAGGLTVENVSEAIAEVRPWGVDVSSGVERAPGLKDHQKVKEFIKKAKGQ